MSNAPEKVPLAEAGMELSDSFNLRPFWMPFTSNRAFKQQPRLVARAEGHHYYTPEGRKLFDTFSGLWTTGAGHCHPKIVEAVQKQVATLDYAIAFQVSHPGAFELAEKVVDLAPAGFDHCFFVNSGSEAVDTALKIAIAYHRARGDGTRTRIVGRERGYHGVNFGGMSVGGMPANRKMFNSSLLPNVSHLAHTHLPEQNAFTRGQPAHGANLADELERYVAFYDASNIAAVIVEPVAGSAGVLVPPVGYLEKLRAICTRHGILLIFDEVITGFGRTGAAFAAERFNVKPDIITVAKGITNGVIPMGAVLVGSGIHDAFMNGPEHLVEFFHGYTYSGHPVATAAGLATLAVYEEEGTFARARSLEKDFEDAIHGLRDCPNVADIRNFGLMGCVELAPRPGAPGARGFEVHLKCFEEGMVVRNGMDNISFSPFLNSTPDEFAYTFDTLRRVLERIA
jgi:beta-alanine--pyruvate transaminase